MNLYTEQLAAIQSLARAVAVAQSSTSKRASQRPSQIMTGRPSLKSPGAERRPSTESLPGFNLAKAIAAADEAGIRGGSVYEQSVALASKLGITAVQTNKVTTEPMSPKTPITPGSQDRSSGARASRASFDSWVDTLDARASRVSLGTAI